jgi:hypothetical protein
MTHLTDHDLFELAAPLRDVEPVTRRVGVPHGVDAATAGWSRRLVIGLVAALATLAVLFVLALAAHSRSSAPGPAKQSGHLARLRHSNELLTIDSSGRFVAYNPATDTTRILVAKACSDSPCAPADWSPDGRWIAYRSDCDPAQTPPCSPKQGLWVKRADAPPRHIAPTSSAWSWAPRGATLANMSMPTSGTPTLSLINPATGRSKTLARVPGHVWDLVWSPDGTKIAFLKGKTIEIISTSTGTRAVISPLRPVNGLGTFSWSPDSRRIAFSLDTRPRGGHYMTYVATASGSGTPELLGEGTWPAWSPDGRWIAYKSVTPNEGLWTVKPNGSDRVQLGSFRCCIDPGEPPVWAPDSSRVVWADRNWNSFIAFRPGHSSNGHPITLTVLAEWTQAPSRVYLNPIFPRL